MPERADALAAPALGCSYPRDAVLDTLPVEGRAACCWADEGCAAGRAVLELVVGRAVLAVVGRAVLVVVGRAELTVFERSTLTFTLL